MHDDVYNHKDPSIQSSYTSYRLAQPPKLPALNGVLQFPITFITVVVLIYK